MQNLCILVRLKIENKMRPNMHPMLNIAVRAARKAGDVISRSFEHIDSVKVIPKGKNDFCTEVDHLLILPLSPSGIVSRSKNHSSTEYRSIKGQWSWRMRSICLEASSASSKSDGTESACGQSFRASTSRIPVRTPNAFASACR